MKIEKHKLKYYIYIYSLMRFIVSYFFLRLIYIIIRKIYRIKIYEEEEATY